MIMITWITSNYIIITSCGSEFSFQVLFCWPPINFQCWPQQKITYPIKDQTLVCLDIGKCLLTEVATLKLKLLQFLDKQ